MPVVQSPRDIRIVSPNGSAVVVLKAGVPRKVNEVIALEAKRKGAVILSGEPETIVEEVKAVEPEPVGVNRIDALVDAIRVVYNSGDRTKLTQNGEPRAKALEALTGFTATADERAEAQRRYDDEYAG